MRFITPFILASRSPRRRRLLSMVGTEFEVHVSDVDEAPPPGMRPGVLTEHIAHRKAFEVAERYPEALTLGADTIVVVDDDVLGKPANVEEARLMLMRLSGRSHVVYTGIALVHPASGRAVTASDATGVTFGDMDREDIDAYVATGSPLDKAGAYGIQDDRGALFVRRIEGDYYNVVGLPLYLLYRTVKSTFSDLLRHNGIG